MSHKTKIGEEVTGETDEFLFCLSLVAIVRTAGCDKIKFIRLDGGLLCGPRDAMRRAGLSDSNVSGCLAGWLSVIAGIVSKRRYGFLHHLIAP